VAAHSSFPQDARALWLSRYAGYAVAAGADPADAENASASVDANLDLFAPDVDQAILQSAGFADATLFYAAFTWRGWIGHA
jgi:tRNA (cmo5U34)-methyltransferase